MARDINVVGTATIAAAGTESTAISSRLGFGFAADIIVYAPDALTGVVNIQVSFKDSPVAADWRDLTIDGANVVIGANDAVVVPSASFRSMRFKSAGAEASERVFTVASQIDI